MAISRYHVSMNTNELAQQVIQCCVERQIKVVAFDFDLTMVSVHTQGLWERSVEELLVYVQPWAKTLIEVLLDSSKVFMAVVTFSSQPKMIRTFIQKLFPKKINKIKSIPVCANTGLQCIPFGGASNAIMMGKGQHLRLAMDHIVANQGIQLKNSNVLLLDDDQVNINIAREDGFRYCHIPEHFTLEKLLQVVKAIELPTGTVDSASN